MKKIFIVSYLFAFMLFFIFSCGSSTYYAYHHYTNAMIAYANSNYQQVVSELDNYYFSDYKEEGCYSNALKLYIKATNMFKRQQEEAIRLSNEQILRAKAIIRDSDTYRKKVDSFSGTTWYYDQSSPQYVNSRTAFYVYLGHDENGYSWMRMVIQYKADDWLFIKNSEFNIDGEHLTYYCTMKRDNDTRIWEWCDETVEQTELDLLKAVANSHSTTIRFHGSQYYHDYTVTSSEKRAIKNILKLYDAFNLLRHQ